MLRNNIFKKPCYQVFKFEITSKRHSLQDLKDKRQVETIFLLYIGKNVMALEDTINIFFQVVLNIMWQIMHIGAIDS